MSDLIIQNYIDYIYLEEDFSFINEGVLSFGLNVTKDSAKRIMSRIKHQFVKGDFKGIQSFVKRMKVPKVDSAKLRKTASSKIPGFDKSYSLSKRILSNSYNKVPKKLIDYASLLIATKASGGEFAKKSGGLEKATRKTLKDFSQAFGEEEKKAEKKAPLIKLDPDEVIGIAFIGASIYLAWYIISGITTAWIIGTAGFVLLIIMMVLYTIGSVALSLFSGGIA